MVAKGFGARRLAALLAAAGVEARDVLALVRELRMMPADEFMDMFDAAREQLHRASTSSEAVALADAPYRGPDAPGMSSDFAAQVERLLVGEAGMTKTHAARSLDAALRRRPGAPRRVPEYNPKDGFSRWLRQLSQEFSLSEILHAASAVRNSRVHGEPDDWLGRK